MSTALDAVAHPAAPPPCAARAQDDFYRHANGLWSDGYVLPPHRAEATMLGLLADKVQDDLAALVQQAVTAGPDSQDPSAREIAALYASFMDEDRIQAQGMSVYEPDLRAIAAAGSREELARHLGRLQAQGIGGAVDFSVSNDTVRARQYVLIVTQAGLGLPAAQYGLPQHQQLLRQYRAHVQVMLEHAAVPRPQDRARDLVRLESELARGHVAAPPANRAQAHICQVADLAARGHGFAWAHWLQGLGQPAAQAAVWVRQPDFLDAFDTWWRAHDLEELKLWVTWRYLHEMVPFGPRQVFADNFRFYGQTLNSFTQPRPRWMRAVSFVETFLGDTIGERYLQHYLAPGTADAARDLVARLARSYRQRLADASWMDASTRAAALEKLDGMVYEIGAPSRTATDHDLRFDPADLIGNVKRGRARHLAQQLSKLGTPIDRTEWKVPAQTVTAYYRHGLNQVVVPAALLQPPFFSPGADPARNFALLGSIVCHEMSHAFDSRGSRFDGAGRQRDWWAPHDRTEFTRRAQLLIEQYGRYRPHGAAGPAVDGTRTLSENIADIAGLTVAQHAFSTYLADHRAQHPPEQDQAQLRSFFTHWATMWRAKTTAERTLERLATDRHAPAEFRCNGALGNVEAFYTAFDIHPADALYIQPENRFTLV